MIAERRDPADVASNTVLDIGRIIETEHLPVPVESVLPGQVASPHLAAFAGIVVLAVLGGVLLLRKRLEERSAIGTTRDAQSDEFVTDRERVRRLITDNGGRMKQSRIVDSVDWSKAKVSRLLADLEEDGQVTKLRLGRENLVCLPGNEPTASRSPEQSRSGSGTGAAGGTGGGTAGGTGTESGSPPGPSSSASTSARSHSQSQSQSNQD